MSEDRLASPHLSEMAYEHAVRGLDSQAEVLNDIRSRAYALILASGAVATLFSGLVLDKADATLWLQSLTAVPLVLFLCTVLPAIKVLVPTGKQGEEGKLQLVASATEILKLDGSDESRAREQAARGFEEMWDANQPVIEKRMDSLRWAGRALGAQVVCWVILLITIEVFA